MRHLASVLAIGSIGIFPLALILYTDFIPVKIFHHDYIVDKKQQTSAYVGSWPKNLSAYYTHSILHTIIYGN